MKKIYLLTAVLLAALSCKPGGEIENKVFLGGQSRVEKMLLPDGATGMETLLTVGMAVPEVQDVKVTVAPAPEKLDTYKKAFYDDSSELLPASCYTLSATTLTIPAGSVRSAGLPVAFKDLRTLDLSKTYVLPVTVSASDLTVLESARTVYYYIKEAALVNVVADIAKNRLWPDWKDATPVTDMETFTMEILFYGNAWKNEISTLFGIEDCFLLRVGDAQLPPNQIQIAYGTKDAEGALHRGHFTSSTMKLQPGVWYHLAVTFDHGMVHSYLNGVEKEGGQCSDGIDKINFGVPHSEEDDGKPRCLWIGYSYDSINHSRFLDGRVSEVRIWNKALTKEEVNAPNHFYKVDPDAEGLVCYWKFDEGAGNVVRDHTRYGNDLTSQTTLVWKNVELPEK